MTSTDGSSERSDHDSGSEELSDAEGISQTDDTANPSNQMGSSSASPNTSNIDSSDLSTSSDTSPDDPNMSDTIDADDASTSQQDDSPTFIRFPPASTDDEKQDDSQTFVRFSAASTGDEKQDDSATISMFPTANLGDVATLFSTNAKTNALLRARSPIVGEPTIVPDTAIERKIKGNLIKTIGNRFEPKVLIVDGPCGKVYMAMDTKSRTLVALKHERAVDNGFSTLRMEYRVLQRLRNAPCKFPKVVWFGEEDGFNVMAMELYDMSLHDLADRGRMKLPLKTVVGIAKHVLKQLIWVHDMGLIHRNVNPAQILINKNKKRVSLAGFRHCKPFQIPSTKTHIQRRHDRPVINDYIYASLNEHQRSDQSRRDDLESLGYVLVYLLNGPLPWAKLNMSKIRSAKMATSIESLCSKCPTSFCLYLNYCRKLEFNESPDYEYLMNLFDETAHQRSLGATALLSPRKSSTKKTSFARVSCGSPAKSAVKHATAKYFEADVQAAVTPSILQASMWSNRRNSITPQKSVTIISMEPPALEYSKAEVQAAVIPSILQASMLSSRRTTAASSTHYHSARPSEKLVTAVDMAKSMDLNTSTAKDRPPQAQNHLARAGEAQKNTERTATSVSLPDGVSCRVSRASRRSIMSKRKVSAVQPKPKAKTRARRKFMRRKEPGRESKELMSREDDEESSDKNVTTAKKHSMAQKSDVELTAAERRVMLMDQWLDTR